MTDDQRKLFEDDLLRRFCRDDDFPVIDGFEILARVGRGGMGVVFHAMNSQTRQECAIKVLSTLSDVAYARFAAESKTHKLLGEHPNVVSFYGVGLCSFMGHEDVPYIECQFIEGGNLRANMEQVRERESVSNRSIFKIMKQICSALTHAHSLDVTHRDVKPENILIDNNSIVYLADFGIATREKLGRFTRFGRGAGTDSYIAPEVLIGRTPKSTADVYSCGILLFELITGDIPDRDLAAIENPSHQLSPWSKVLQKATEIDPRNRYSTISEFLTGLTECVGSEMVGSSMKSVGHTHSITSSAVARRSELGNSVELLFQSRIEPKSITWGKIRHILRFSFLANAQVLTVASDGSLRRYDCDSGQFKNRRVKTSANLGKHGTFEATNNGKIALIEAQGESPMLVRLSDGAIIQKLDSEFALIDEQWLVQFIHDSGITYIKTFDLSEISLEVNNWTSVTYSDLIKVPVKLQKPAIMKQGRIAASESDSSSTWLIDIETGTSRRELFSKHGNVTPLALTNDASHLAIQTNESVCLVSFKTGLTVTEHQVKGNVTSSSDLHFNYNATVVAAKTRSDDCFIFSCWRVSDGMTLVEFSNVDDFQFCWSPDRDWLACQLEGHGIEILELQHEGSQHAEASSSAIDHFRPVSDSSVSKLGHRIQRAGYFALRHLNNSIALAQTLMFVLLLLGFLSLSADNDDSASISCFIFALILRIWTAFIPTVVDWGDSWVNSLSDSSRTKRPLQ